MGVVSCRFTSDEFDQVTDAATAAEVSVSAYIRAAVMGRIQGRGGSNVERISVSPSHRWLIAGGGSLLPTSRTHLAAEARVVVQKDSQEDA